VSQFGPDSIVSVENACEHSGEGNFLIIKSISTSQERAYSTDWFVSWFTMHGIHYISEYNFTSSAFIDVNANIVKHLTTINF